ncbi:uncharacterized protein F5Z01DRAFT_8270 [Emericellopsis atlantica]|uniref:Chromo domain-containing protein n=1 Tax=Emericellopsis atlantica TaxID=2614577 RepID=A0A9P7ZVC0_9HYPO|nr:uncharacterized protein F5Z01DRAFT_8270 [Emericellopsis atlantica]KAG9258895.1 hypothetical protein F5Z01DRAFT_8270 [Emericellopsis atlantica]
MSSPRDSRPFTHHTPPARPPSTLPMPGETKIVIPIPCIPRYKRGTGPSLQRITLQPVHDSTAYIVERIFLPPKGTGRDGRELPKRPGYIIGWTDLPAARKVVTARDVLTYVSPRKLEEWESSFEEELNAERRELKAAKERASQGPEKPAGKRRGRPPKHAGIESAAAVVDEDSDQPAGAAMAVGGAMLATPTKKAGLRAFEDPWGDEPSREATELPTEDTDASGRNDGLLGEQAADDEKEVWQGFSNEPSVLDDGSNQLDDVDMEEEAAPTTIYEGHTVGQQGVEDDSDEEDEELSTRALARELYRRGVEAMSKAAEPNGAHEESREVQDDEDDDMAEFYDAPETADDAGVEIKDEPVDVESVPISTLASVETTQAQTATPADTNGAATMERRYHQLNYPQWVAIGSSKKPSQIHGLAAQSTSQSSDSPMLPPPSAEQGSSSMNKSKSRGSLGMKTPAHKARKLSKSSPASGSRKRAKSTPRSRSSAAQTPVLVNGAQEWVVKEILDDETYQVEDRGLVRYFKVRWEGDWPPDQNPTWEPEDNLPAQLVKNYFKMDYSRLPPAARKRRRERALLRASGSAHFVSVRDAFAGELDKVDSSHDMGNGGTGTAEYGNGHEHEQDEPMAVDDTGSPHNVKRPRFSFGMSGGVVVGPWGGS